MQKLILAYSKIILICFLSQNKLKEKLNKRHVKVKKKNLLV